MSNPETQFENWKATTSNHVTSTVAVVTGHGNGIGAAITDRLLAEGGFVVGLDLNTDDIKPHQNLVSIQGDITKDCDLAKLDQDLSFLPYVDALVNNAGIMLLANLAKVTSQSMLETLNVNVVSAVQVTRKLLPWLDQSGHPTIVNLASQLAYTGEAGAVAYGASKAAMLGVTRSLARELGPKIRVNAVAPGPIRTLMTDQYQDPQWEAQKTQKLIAGRFGTPQEVANVVNFLISQEASYIYGQSISVNGGGYLS